MFTEGFVLGLSLILAIGPQNIFVIRQGLSGKLVLLTAAVVSLCDSVLIGLGVLGAGQFLSQNYWLKMGLTIFGIIFLIVYGLKAIFRAVFKIETLNVGGSGASSSYSGVILRGIGFSWLNPHAILDTVVIMGSIAAQYPLSTSIIFGMGAVVASFTWFFLLAFVAKGLSRYLESPITWKVIDLFVGAVCLNIAHQLLRDFIQ